MRSKRTKITSLRDVQSEVRVFRRMGVEASADGRPKTRAECVDGERPCPWVTCRYHLALDVTPAGGIVEYRPGVELDELPETCSLDIADRGGLTLEEVGEVFNVTRERIRQIEASALVQLRKKARALAAFASEAA